MVVCNTSTSYNQTSTSADNGNTVCNAKVVDAVKQPSYVSLACCISGYTNLTTYNSKQREGFRSRDISPARITGVSREVSPHRGDDGSSSGLASYTSDCGNFLTAQPKHLTDKEHRSDKGGEKMWNGNRSNGTATKSNGCASKMTTSTFTSSSTTSGSESYYSCESHSMVSATHYQDRVITTRRSDASIECRSSSTSLSSSSSSDTSSFILQRVERLYGPGALAQGFYTRHRPRYTPPAQEVSSDIAKDVEKETSLPVLKLLRPEFRAQLSLAKRKSGSSSSTPNRSIDEGDSTPKERTIPIVIETEEVKTDLPAEKIETEKPSGHKDGQFYLQLVRKEVENLERLAAGVEAELETQGTVPEEMEGRLRAAAGKARLLATQKLAQFEGLCQKNICQDKTEDFPTTCEDLAGFWDMVSIQVSNVHDEFDRIYALRAAGWKEQPPAETSSTPTTPVTNGNTPVRRGRRSDGSASKMSTGAGKTTPGKSPSGKSPSSASSKARDEARKRLIEERRKAMRQNLNNSANEDTVFVP